MDKMISVFICFVLLLSACEGPVGPQGPQGERGERGERGLRGLAGRDGFNGEDGKDLSVQVEEGTILNRNYTEGNPRHASVPIGQGSWPEPTVLFLGIENENGVYNRIDFAAVIWGGTSGDYAVPGSTSSWYILVYDRGKDLAGSNYQVKFIQ